MRRPEREVQGAAVRIAVDTIHTAAGLRIEGLRLLDGAGTGPGTTAVGYGYYPGGQLAGAVNSSGLPYEDEYDDADRITTCTDRSGRCYSHVYDDGGRVVRGIGEGGHLSALFHYDTVKRITTVTDSLGHATQYHCDEQQHVTKTVDPLGNTTQTDYDEAGRVIARADEINRTTRFDLDAHGDPIRITEPDGTTLSRRISRTTPTGLVSTWTYDANNQPATLTNPFGQPAFSYDAGGRETTRYFGSGGVLAQSWDACDRLSAQSVWARDRTAEDGEGAYISTQERAYGYRADGMPTVVTDRLRGRRDFELTPAGRITRVSAQSWNESYAYDPLGNITRAHDIRMPDNASAGERAYSGTLLRSAGRTSYEYDDRGRLVRMLVRTLSGQRREWRYAWNAKDQLVRIDTPAADRGRIPQWVQRYSDP
ncbi:hypothetical protein ACH4SK_41990 [Streptomyces inhibens]|uniref:hypothetical protein n=1 Tax=Streptomyces inhibens TaxID=2293571 RepID=UPI0037A7ADC1